MFVGSITNDCVFSLVVAPDSSQVPSKSDKPTILWATSNKTEFDVVKYSLGKDCNVKANRESAQYEFMIEVKVFR